MLFDAIRLAEGAELNYMAVPTGATLPGPGTLGDLFYVTGPGPDAAGLYLYDGTNWQPTSYAFTPVDRAGDTMTGFLTLVGDPTNALHAATKQYVDVTATVLARVADAETISGTWTFSTSPLVPTPTLGTHAANKAYVDSALGGTGTDLTYTAATRILASSTGADATLPLFTSTEAGLTPPSGGGTANFLRADGTWALTSGTPAGSSAQIQYNNAGAFGASADFTWNNLTKALTVLGTVAGYGWYLFKDTVNALEGGQITFERPTTTTLPADVTLDVYNNSFRIFTAGGQGAYLTLTSLASGTYGSRILTDIDLAGFVGVTNLTYTPSTRLLASSTGTDVTLPLFTGSDAGLVPGSGGGTANFLRADGTWTVPPGGGGGSPGGSTTQVQYNNSGAFAGDDDFTWDSASRTLTLGAVGGLATVAIPNNLIFNGDTLFIDSTLNRVGIGESSPEATLSVRSRGTSNTRGILLHHNDDATAFSHAKFIGRRSRGTHTTPTAVLANDSLVGYLAQGYKATAWSNTVGGLYIYAAENWTDTATGTYVTIRGPAPGGTTVTERARFEHLLATFTGTVAATSFTAGGNTVLHAGNYNSYAPTLSGAGASGSWGISVTGSAGSVSWTNVSGRPTTVSSFSNDAGYLTAASLAPFNSQIVGNVSASFDASGTSGIETRNDGSGAAVMGFHRSGAYAIKLGLDTDNIFKLGGWSQGASAFRWTSDASGNFVATGNISANSDRRLKRDITRIESALDKMLTLSGVTYTRVDTGERGIGLIAQDVETVFPEAVHTHPDELNTKSVAYGNLVGVLVEALRELTAEIEVLKHRLTAAGV